MPEGNPQAYAPGWMEWLKKPENLMTGIVLLAGLTQPRREGQNVAGQVGERLLGAMAFRGGLNESMRKQDIEERRLRGDEEFQQGRLQQGQRGLDLQQQQIQQQGSLAREQMTHAEKLHTTPRPLTPEEAAYQRANARESNSRASLYDRTDPNLRAGSGDGAKPEDQFRALQRQQAMEAIIAQHTDPLTGQVKIDPATLASEMTKWDNAMMYAEALRQSGYTPEVVKNPDGSWVVQDLGRKPPEQDPTPAPGALPSTQSPPAPVVSILPESTSSAGAPQNALPLGPAGKAILEPDSGLKSLTDEQLNLKLKSANRGEASQIRIEIQRRAREKKRASQKP